MPLPQRIHSRDTAAAAAAAAAGGVDSGALTEVERSPATEPILRDLHLWQLTRQLQRVFLHVGDGQMQRTRAKDQLEAKNILDRWLLSFQLDYRGQMSPTLPIFPLRLSLEDSVNQKLVDECLEKQFSSCRRNAERIARALVEAVANFEAEVERRVGDYQDVAVTFWERRLGGQPAEGQLCIGELYRSPACPRLWFLARNFGLLATARMMLRYETLGTGSLQWGDPVTVHHALYDLMGVRSEGFASPLNSKLLGKPDAAFCSLFADTDAAFGSLGDFFSVSFDHRPGGWTVNPPFIEELMSRVADKVLQHLDRDAVTNWFFVTFPMWADCPGWQKLAESRHTRRRWDLNPRRFTVQDCYGRVLCPKMTLSIFAVGSLPGGLPADCAAIEQCFLNVDVDSVVAAWRQHCLTVDSRAAVY